MESNTTAPREGFRKKSNYVRRHTREPVRYMWTTEPVGRTAIYVVQRLGEQMLGPALNNALITREIVKNGISGDKLLDRVQHMLPEFAAYYAQRASRQLTAHILYKRVHQGLVYENGPKGEGGKPIRPKEHYTRSKRLRPHVEKMEKLYMAGTATLEQMRIAGGG